MQRTERDQTRIETRRGENAKANLLGLRREELKCPRGLPAPCSGAAGRERLLWARLVGWLFCKRPAKLTLQRFFAKTPDGRPLWVVDHIGGGPHDSRVDRLEIVTREERNARASNMVKMF